MNKRRFLAIIVADVAFAACAGFLTWITAPLPCESLGWLSPKVAKAHPLMNAMCCVYWIEFDYDLVCGAWEPCSEPEPGDTSPVKGAELQPARPSDEVDWWGRKGAFDPQTSDILFDLPIAAISVPARVSAYHTPELPADVPPPADGTIGAPFFAGVWIEGEGKTVDEFDRPIVINASYPVSALASLSGEPSESFDGHARGLAAPLLTRTASPPTEDQLRLSMYDPTTLSWIKLCTRVDPYTNKVSAALLWPTPLEEGGNSLFAIIADDTPPLDQTVDGRGNTTLSIPGSDFMLGVPAGTVEVGTYFEVTPLTRVPESDLVRLLPTPVDIKACQADYTTVNRVTQVTQFPKPMEVEFVYDANTLSRAGGRANLTIVSLQNRQWFDMEEFGSKIVRGNSTISVEIDSLGTFGMAAR